MRKFEVVGRTYDERKFFVVVTVAVFVLNPFTAKCGQRQISSKFPNFIFSNFDKQIASCESTGRELSFEWDIIGFRLQSQKLKLPHKTLSNTLAVKGLITNIKFNFGSKDQGYKIEGPDLKRI